MAKLINLEGEKFNEWTVLRRDGSDKRGNARWLCRCSCGTEGVVESSCLRRGISISCGCIKREGSLFSTAGFSGSPLAGVWVAMMKRCYDLANPRYDDWGGRGVSVCEEWHHIEVFINWALRSWESGLQLDREDNSLGYSPQNCRFITPQDNSNNRRVNRSNKTGYEGVYRRRSGKFRAYIRGKGAPMDGKLLHLGTFNSALAAVAARNKFIVENGLKNKVQET